MNYQEKVWKVGVWVGVLLVVFLAAISIKSVKEIGYVGKNYPAMNTITVNGLGEEVSIPDIAIFSFSVTESAKTVKEAQDKATKKNNAALKALEDNGIEKKDIKTIVYNINPKYEYVQELCTSNGVCRSGKQVLTGYEVSQSTEIKVRDIEKAGSLFETIGSLGVQNVNGLSFSIDDIEVVKAAARQKAIENAKEKAEKLSDALGVRLVRITGFYDSSDDVPYYGYGRGGDAVGIMKAEVAVPPSIPSGEQKVTSRVSVTYEIR